jgi:hypothetical protein
MNHAFGNLVSPCRILGSWMRPRPCSALFLGPCTWENQEGPQLVEQPGVERRRGKREPISAASEGGQGEC